MAKAKAKTKSAESVSETVANAVKTAKVVKASPKNSVFKITLTAVYNNIEIDADQISDGVFNAMTKAGKGLALLHVDSIKSVSKPDEAIAKILAEVSSQSEDAMSRKTADDGSAFVAVENKNDAKK